MQKVFVFGKALWDIVLSTDIRVKGNKFCLPFREKTIINDLMQEPGGGAINISFSLKKLGFEPLPLAVSGKDLWAELLLGQIKEKKITSSLLVFSKNKTGNSIIISGQNGLHTALIYPGANKNIKKKDFDFSKIKKARWWFILSWGNSNREIADLIADKKEKLGCSLAFNPGRIQLEKKDNVLNLLKVSDILFVNEKELGLLLEQKISKAQVKKAMVEAVGLGPKIIVVTLGRFGSIVYDGGYFYSAPIYPAKCIDALGAGDAYSSAFLAWFLKTGEIEQAILAGTINSALVVSQIGTLRGQLNKEQLAQKIQQAKIRVKKESFKNIKI